ncbi:protein HEG homolog 1 isoform X2 [Rhineura floridana]|uniref:protein HEG homolog 1 isoform X2 n=1 Tax=Rhineura floridana TaxID=261503 RepID=UPI002AC87A41|nr:protein HEG homolog 1 isoform X2 [Rhineura floridana]
MLFPRENESRETSAVSVGAGDPGTAGHTSSNPAIMSSQKLVGTSNTEIRISSSHTHNTDTFSTFGGSKGKRLRMITSSASGSTAGIINSASYTEMNRSGALAQHSSASVMQTRRADASASSLDIAELETVFLRIHSPRTPVSSLSEDNHPATGSSHHHTDSKWNADSTTSSLHIISTARSSATANRGAERTSQIFTDSISLTDSARKDSVSHREIATFSDGTLFPSQTTHSRGRSNTSDVTQLPDSSSRIFLTQSYLSPKTTSADNSQPRTSSNTGKSISSSQTDSASVSDLTERGGERTLRTSRDISSSFNATPISTTSGNEISASSGFTDSSHVLTAVQTGQMDLLPEDNDFTEAALAHSQAFSETTAAEDNGQLRSSTSTGRSISTSWMDGASVSGLTERGRERTLRTLRDISSIFNATQISTTSSIETSTSSGLTDSSHAFTSIQTGQMDLSPEDNDFTETAVTQSQAPSETTEESGQSRTRSNTERCISSSHVDGVSVSGQTETGTERTLQTLKDITSSFNATPISATTSNEISASSDLTDSSHVLTPVQTGQMGLSPEDNDFTETALTYSQAFSETTATEESGQPKSSLNTERSISSYHMDGVSVSGFTERGGERTLRTLRDISSSFNATPISTTSINEISASSDLMDSSHVLTAVQTRQMDLLPEDNDFTEAALAHSQAFSETTVTEDSDHQPRSRSNTDSISISHTDSAPVPGPSDRSGENTLRTQSNITDSHNATQMSITGTGSSLQPVKVSEAERRVSSASTDSIYLSAIFIHGGERTTRSLPDNSTSPDAADSTSYKTETSRSSEPTLILTSGAEILSVSLSEVQPTGPSTERSVQHSSEVPLFSTSSKDLSTFGNGNNSVSGSSVSRSYTESTYSSATFSKEEAQTVQSIVNTTFVEATESPSSYMEEFNGSELNPSSSKVYSQRTDFSEKYFDISGPATETFQSLSSSRIPTYSSFQSEPSDTGADHQPMSGTDTGKRTSVSHTDSTYISTTFTRGGERTLLSVPNSSMSADSSESSTFYAEMSSPSESAQSSFSATQSRRSNMSSNDMDFSVLSTEPLAVQSLKTAAYSSVLSEVHTTQLYSKSESTSDGSLSFASSTSTSPEQDSLPPTRLPALFSSSESPFPLSSSAFPSLFSSSPQTLLVTFSPRLSSTVLPTLPPFPSLLPSLSSTPSSLQPSKHFETSVSMAVSEGTTGTDPPTAGSSHSEVNSHTGMYQLKDSSDRGSTGSSPLLTETTEQLTDLSSPRIVSLDETKSSKEQNVSLPRARVGKTPSVLPTFPTYLLESTTESETAKATTSTLSYTTTQKDAFSFVVVTTGKNFIKTVHTTLGLPTLASSTDYVVTTKAQKAQPPFPTKIPSYATGMPTKAMETSISTSIKVTKPSTTATHPPKMFSSRKTTAGTSSTSPVPTKPTTVMWVESRKTFSASHGKANVCTMDTCLNNGKCSMDSLMDTFQCQCSPGWQGEDCSMDVDECLSNPCPALATCTNTQGSFQCMCSLGYQMEKGKCNLVRTFVGQFPLMFNTTGGKYLELHQIEEDIINMLNSSLSTLPGYYTSTVKASRQSGTVQVSVLSTFSLVSNITLFDIVSTVRSHIRACKAPTETCQFISKLTLLHRVGGLCKHKDPECDKETSVCVDLDGIAICQCQAGYFKYNKLDHSCRACEDGYKLENSTCVSCPFGLGGFNCGNPYQLITIVIAAAGGGLLLIMGIALIVTCCQKNKNDISKLIFKSGDFQMSPYAEYPKNPRVQDWGRETIEMQENGSTKNLLQMTDVYYMPTNLRNPELERNGLYPPYTGLPGSRHSCIYPGQYNPSFVSDDSRRRDYF